MFVFKLILRACRKQFRQLGWKNFEQRPIILRSMSKNDGEKTFDKNFFSTNWSIWQTENITDTGTVKLPSKWPKNVAQCPMMKKKKNFVKKNFCKISPWTRGKQLWQIFRLFFDEKKTDDSLFKFGRTWKKHREKLCQNKDMSSNWSFGLVECSFVELTEKVSKKRWPIFAESPKKMGEKHFWQKKILP